MTGSGKPRLGNHRTGIGRALFSGLWSSLFLILAFPPYSFWGFAFLIPFPLFAIARSDRLSPSRLAFWAGLGSLPGWAWTHFWIGEISAAGLIPLVIQLGFYTFLFVWIANHLVRRWGREAIVLPIVWVGIEFFRGSILWTGYPWYLIAHPLIESPRSILAMPAALGGVYLVSYLCAAYSCLLLRAITANSARARTRSGLAAAGLFTAWIILGLIVTHPSPDPTQRLRVGVIQPDVPQDNRMVWTVRQRVRDWLTLRDLTIEASRDPRNPEPLDVIVWPEGFVPGWTLDPQSLDIERRAHMAWDMEPRTPDDAPLLQGLPSKIDATTVVDEMLILQKALGIPMVVGSVAFDNLRIVDSDDGVEYRHDAMYNSAFVVVGGEPQPVWYDKLHLTPFGEVMPLISRWGWLEHAMLSFGARGMEFVLDPGEEARVLSVPVSRGGETTSVELATPICFEGTISSVCRRLVFKNGKRRAGVMVNMTNDGWFGSWDPGRESHLLTARWRCIELNTPMIRCANTGISCAIDHNGRVETRRITPVDPADPREGYLIADVVLGQGTTPFAHIGDMFGWICFAAVCFGVFGPLIGRRMGLSPTSGSDARIS